MQQGEKESTMSTLDEAGKEKVVIRGVSRDEEGSKKVEKTEVIKLSKPDTLRYIEKKLWDKGVLRMERHPVDGLGGLNRQPKSGHGGKYTWEGPRDPTETELLDVPVAIDERDPNYVDEEVEERIVKGEDKDLEGLVVGEVEVAKTAEANDGVARIEVRPPLQV
ncbi:hypothetical protein BVC80_1711g20 [Macleaya cordata]|uniref:Uncharacterized protein n=1 Tax=Macleaya cordata TaxID=56857 RepID=A0A200Q2G6_MACCD|nr:hypothetical protein BVC80_1711g20 [Macleaya cordata]